MKSCSDTWWESRLQSVHAIRYQASEVREALLETRQTINNPVAKVEALALAEEVGSHRFLICCVVWCEILTKTNTVNKLLQSAAMQLWIWSKMQRLPSVRPEQQPKAFVKKWMWRLFWKRRDWETARGILGYLGCWWTSDWWTEKPCSQLLQHCGRLWHPWMRDL